MDWIADRAYPLLRILLLLVLFFPLMSAAVVAISGRGARRVALILSLIHLGLTAAVVLGALPALDVRGEQISPVRNFEYQEFEPEFVPGDPGVEGSLSGATHRTKWTLLSLSDAATNKPGPNIQFFIGVDGLNLWLMALCSLMMVPAIIVSWDAVAESAGRYYAGLFVLQCGALGAFLSFDVILFYVFFEFTLIPAFFLIGGWGTGSRRRDAARKFFLYTLAGSLLTLVGVIGIVLTNPDPASGRITFSLPDLMRNVQLGMVGPHVEHLRGSPADLAGKQNTQFWFFLAFMAGFMVKVPVWPLHTWLPDAYREAPLGVTILLTSLLAKLGTYGILRFVLPLTPDAAIEYGLPAIGTLAAFGIVYGAFCAFGQRDIRMLIAYSSISHLGFLVLGLFAFNAEGLSGAVLHMVNHGVATGAFFALLAFLLDRYGTTDMRQYGGLMGRFPLFAFFTFVICLANIGLPGLNNFVSEMLMLGGLFDARNPDIHRHGLAVVAVSAIFLSAWYILTMLQRVFFNPLREPPSATAEPPADVHRREAWIFGGAATLCLLLGLFPQVLLDPMKADIAVLTTIGDFARDRVRGTYPEENPGIQLPSEPDATMVGPGPKLPGPKGGGKGKGKGEGNIGKDKGARPGVAPPNSK